MGSNFSLRCEFLGLVVKGDFFFFETYFTASSKTGAGFKYY